ncbi:hypothetical protein [Actinoplanes sp. NPDC049118]|uniref:hypothetical protein n=1 Tax=Actinoplanes sp. NPDC049118 TaxID=3155769 RepID=UPI0033C2CA33
MDAANHFETPTTMLLTRLEWLAALAVSITLALLHVSEINWAVFIGLFVIIDVIGYIPGAIAFRRSGDHRIGRGYYLAYNTMHSLITGGAIAGAWALAFGPEWALLAIPIHLFGDRGIFGNSLKPFGVPFEPHPVPEFTRFEQAYNAGRPEPAASEPRRVAHGAGS